jgi:UDP-N-acetylmuramoyl-L-alanyl-D-glutamate--2,6-diaminopimelate ligase
MRNLKKFLRKFAPGLFFAYHYLLAYAAALAYRFPSRRLTVIGITGTNGKSSTVEFVNAIFEEAGYATVISSSIRVKIGNASQQSAGRSMPGRFFIQRCMRRALDRGCTVAIIEMTSEGVKQSRHRAIALDCLIFLNLAPEHIESHGSYQAYADAKFQLGLSLARSAKRPRIMVANADDAEGARYLGLPVEVASGFSLAQAAPWHADAHGGRFTYAGLEIDVKMPGEFYIKNALAAAHAAAAFGIAPETIKKGIEKVVSIPGRMQEIRAGQEFSVIVDYALTPDALEALYKTYADKKKICIFGSAGGGRDTWKRPVLGKIASEYCESVILTNDIAYDEPGQKIVDEIASGMPRPPEIILDRRRAIRRGLELAQAHKERKDAVVLITGMGIDTEITAEDGSEIPWSDAAVVREELARLGTV